LRRNGELPGESEKVGRREKDRSQESGVRIQEMDSPLKGKKSGVRSQNPGVRRWIRLRLIPFSKSPEQRDSVFILTPVS
jgi:hypothetical protein